MIARIAARAIWRPKLDDTFFTPSACALTFSLSAVVSLFCSARGQLLQLDLEALVVLAAARRRAAALDDRVLRMPIDAVWSRTFESDV